MNLNVFCREVQIVQVLVNLIQNSLDAVQGQEGAWIKIEGFQIEDEKIKICISDSGLTCHIAEPAKVFLPFYTSKSSGKGTGIGLSVSKEIINSHGGEFFLDSSSKHTTFVILLDKGADH